MVSNGGLLPEDSFVAKKMPESRACSGNSLRGAQLVTSPPLLSSPFNENAAELRAVGLHLQLEFPLQSFRCIGFGSLLQRIVDTIFPQDLLKLWRKLLAFEIIPLHPRAGECPPQSELSHLVQCSGSEARSLPIPICCRTWW